MTALEAVIFDVDGTLSDTERDGHRPAFNDAFAAHGFDFTWTAEEYGPLLAITGGRRRIAHDLRARGFGDAADQLAADVHRTKTMLFAERVGSLSARPGLSDLIAGLVAEGVRIAIATTGSRAWVDPLVRNVLGDGVADVVVTGDDVTRLKPDPEVYLRALHALALTPESCLAVEDSAVGLQAAMGAQLATVVVSNDYTADQDFTGAAVVRSDYVKPEPLSANVCRAVHRRFVESGGYAPKIADFRT